jgi:hypothetical protein
VDPVDPLSEIRSQAIPAAGVTPVLPILAIQEAPPSETASPVK